VVTQPNNVNKSNRIVRQVSPLSDNVNMINMSDMVFGGLTTDPFDAYPIQAQPYFPAVVDFCKHVVSLGPGYFNFILSNPVLFEAIVTYSLCVMPNQSRDTKVAMMYHYGRTLSKVGSSLSSPKDRSEDALILAICNLAVICAYCGDDKRFDTHLKGIHRLIEMRGGVEGVQQHGWVKAALSAVEALAGVAPQKMVTAAVSTQTTPTLTPPESPKSTTKPTYPTHPFAPDVCTVISRMPEGFRELALTGHLSVQLMNRLNITRSQIVHLMATATNADGDRAWQELLRASAPIERMAWLTVLVFHLRSSTYTSDCKELAETVMECARIGLKSQAEAEWLLWGACLMIATPDAEKLLASEREQAIVMVFQNYSTLTFEEIDMIAHRFLWSEVLSAGLKASIAHRLM
jgi:hypothetical protein